MKKLLSTVLMLMLVLSLCASASGEDGYKTYTHKSGYSIQYPADWLALDSTNILTLMKQPDIVAQYPNVNFTALYESMHASDMIMFASACGDNVNITFSHIGAPYNAEALVELLFPTLISEYEKVMPGVQLFSNGDLREAGGKEYAFLTYHWDNGASELIGMQFANCDSGILYYITFTSNQTTDTVSFLKNFQHLEKMLASFTF